LDISLAFLPKEVKYVGRYTALRGFVELLEASPIVQGFFSRDLLNRRRQVQCPGGLFGVFEPPEAITSVSKRASKAAKGTTGPSRLWEPGAM